MFGVTGAGLTVVKYLSNDGKKARWNNDLWDRVSLILFRHDAIEIAVWLTCWITAKYVATRTYIFLFYTVLSPLVVNSKTLTNHTVMERDLRLTGSLRGQSTNVVAPKGFEVNNPWKVRLVVFVLGYGRCMLIRSQLEKRIF